MTPPNTKNPLRNYLKNGRAMPAPVESRPLAPLSPFDVRCWALDVAHPSPWSPEPHSQDGLSCNRHDLGTYLQVPRFSTDPHASPVERARLGHSNVPKQNQPLRRKPPAQKSPSRSPPVRVIRPGSWSGSRSSRFTSRPIPLSAEGAATYQPGPTAQETARPYPKG